MSCCAYGIALMCANRYSVFKHKMDTICRTLYYEEFYRILAGRKKARKTEEYLGAILYYVKSSQMAVPCDCLGE